MRSSDTPSIPEARRLTRRNFLAVSAAAAGYGVGLMTLSGEATAALAAAGDYAAVPSNAIRPFRVSFPQEALVDLRQRIAATRWPTRETVTDASQGVRLVTM